MMIYESTMPDHSCLLQLLFCRYGALTPLNFLEGIHRPPSWVKHMRFDTEKDFDKYFSRMRAVITMVQQGIGLMRKAIELNRTNHAVSMVRTTFRFEIDLAVCPRSMKPKTWDNLCFP